MVELKPYVIRAMHEWAIDSQCTPQITVDTTVSGVMVPASFISDGRMVLNIHPNAVSDLIMGNDEIRFDARFSGVPHNVVVPIDAILAIFCRETGKGMVFDTPEPRNFTLLGSWDEEGPDPDSPPPKGPFVKEKPATRSSTAQHPPQKGPPNLKVVK